MTKALLLVLIIIAGLIAGPLWTGNPGYVLIQAGSWEVETSATFAIVLVVLLLLVIWLLEAILRKLLRGGRHSRYWWHQRRSDKGARLLNKGLTQLTAGEHTEAAASFQRAHSLLPDSYLSGLLTGLAWQHAGQPDQQLQAWQQVAPEALATRLLVLRQQGPEAQAQTARQLLRDYPEHPGVLRTLAEELPHGQHWELLRHILPALTSARLLPAHKLQQLARQAYRPLFQAAAGAEQLHASWRSLPRNQRQQSGVRLAYLDELLARNAAATADQVAAKAVRRQQLTPTELLTLPLTQWSGAQELLINVRQHVKQHPDDPEWLLVLGALALAAENAELAERALQQVVQTRPSQRAWLLLGQAREAGNQPTKALSAYRTAAEFSS